MGVGLAIDDFGTGFSSLVQLQRLPVDEIKIDRSFVSTMLDSESDAAIVRSTIDLARNLGLARHRRGRRERGRPRRAGRAWAATSRRATSLCRPLPADRCAEVVRERARSCSRPSPRCHARAGR